MSNPFLNLTWQERSEFSRLGACVAKYIASLAEQRLVKVRDEATGHYRSKRDAEIDHSLQPSDEDFFQQAKLWWKAYG